jgi:hypothetical protein
MDSEALNKYQITDLKLYLYSQPFLALRYSDQQARSFDFEPKPPAQNTRLTEALEIKPRLPFNDRIANTKMEINYFALTN